MKERDRHPLRTDLIKFLDRNPSVDLDAIAGHLSECSSCSEALADIAQVECLLADRSVWEPSPEEDDRDFAAKMQGIIAEVRRIASEEQRANETWSRLRELPVSEWTTFLDKAAEDLKNEGLVNRIILESAAELDRGPVEALPWLNIAYQLAAKLPDDSQRNDCLARVLKNISTARLLGGDFKAALEAVDAGEEHAVESKAGHVYAELRYARAAILMRMGSYIEALPIAREAALRFAEFGETRRVAQCRIIEGGILAGQGDFEEALHVGRTILRTLNDTGGTDRDIAAANKLIGTACFRLGRLNDAFEAAADARMRFDRLGDTPEALRAEWTLAAITLLEGDVAGLSQMRRVAFRYKELGMKGDSGFVQLTIAEELVRREDWEEAERVAIEAARVFADSGAKLFHVQALALLHESIAKRIATPSFVADLRYYIESGDPLSPFRP